ncbi:unnamed protein product [Bursaphelenchus xylophilus]|uniref:(pine wood nematode) hypothetical protein n=1 Tax=Bursaphelenchus xylophilus TaxID=6326 RepID=A0A7I8WGL7_BURXY|nr:unnamed protein product [Bursaphelenchus xylophilus]CAG9111142.1 unnamed protein product [Bursaphelenchus xylophilus]
MAIDLKFLAVVLLLPIVAANPLPKPPRPFKCAGDTDRVCETGFCYDALGFYEGGKNVGCAPPDMCQNNDCFMYKEVFTCCCNTRFCNGKTDSLMYSKYRRFQDNNNVWPTFFPRLHVRNVTTVPQPADDNREVRLSPLKTTTTFPDKSTTFGTTVKKIVPAGHPEHTTTTIQKQAEVATTTLKSTTVKRIETQPPTTTKATVAPTTTSTSTQKLEVTTKAQPKTVQPVAAEDSDFDDDVDDEFDLRTTRSNNNRERPTTSPTTTRKATTKSRRPNTVPPHPTFIPATEAPVIPPKQRETHVQQAFPWYYVTIVGFIIACVLFGIVVYAIRWCRARKADADRRHSNDSAPNSSLDSSRVSDLGHLQANEHAREPVDPLLRKN